jgi:hypothetical protein
MMIDVNFPVRFGTAEEVVWDELPCTLLQNVLRETKVWCELPSTENVNFLVRIGALPGTVV